MTERSPDPMDVLWSLDPEPGGLSRPAYEAFLDEMAAAWRARHGVSSDLACLPGAVAAVEALNSVFFEEGCMRPAKPYRQDVRLFHPAHVAVLRPALPPRRSANGAGSR